MPAADSSGIVRYLPIPGYPQHEAGSDGTIWSLLRGRSLLKPCPDKDGYPLVGLWKDGKATTYRVATLILLTFSGPRPEGTEARHYPDPTRSNNRADNLRWDTHANNIADKLIHGTHQCGEKHGMHAMTEEDIHAIDERLLAGDDHRDIATDFGVCKQEIDAIAGRRLWSHIPQRYFGEEVVSSQGLHCGTSFPVKRRWQRRTRYCSVKCREKS